MNILYHNIRTYTWLTNCTRYLITAVELMVPFCLYLIPSSPFSSAPRSPVPYSTVSSKNNNNNNSKTNNNNLLIIPDLKILKGIVCSNKYVQAEFLSSNHLVHSLGPPEDPPFRRHFFSRSIVRSILTHYSSC
jgi:hypothetical protein